MSSDETRKIETPAPVPVTVLSGFLGAGKTTLLKRILSDPRGIRFGVLINDFGAINIDADLVVETGADQISLANGCICCTIRDDLVEAASRLLSSEPRPDHIIIEASGVSRPLAIVDALFDDNLGGQIRLDSIHCLVDAIGFLDLDFASTELAIDQAACADIVLLNKCDVASAADIEAAETTLLGPVPLARIVRTSFGDVPREILFSAAAGGDGLEAARRRQQEAESHAQDCCACDHYHHDHGAEFESWSWECEDALDLEVFRATMQALPSSVLRAKGILRFSGQPQRRGIVHLVGKRSTVELVDEPPPAVSRLVAIARHGSFDPDELTRRFDRCVLASQRR